MSDGTNQIFEGVYNGDGFTIQQTHRIFERNEKDIKVPVNRINELEVVQGELWGNVWMDNDLYVFDLESDSVKRKIDLTHLSKLENNYRRHQGQSETNQDQVLNGIAYNAEQKSLLVTGKEWNFVYEVTLLNI